MIIYFASFLFILLSITSSNVNAQPWMINGNNNINAATNFLGTTNNNALVFKTNNLERMRINVGTYRGIDIGTPSLNNELRIYGRDSVDYVLPLIITGNIMNQTWGNNPSQTLGRLVRFNQGPSSANGGVNFYDLGIGQDTSFFITNHTVPPSFGLGTIRKRMFVISPQDNVGIHLDPGAKPTANLHSDGTVRFQNLPSGTGAALVIDANGNVFKANPSATDSAGVTALQEEVAELKEQVQSLLAIVNNMKGGIIDISSVKGSGSILHQNIPNPFNQTTRIKYYVPANARHASISISDMSGKQLKTYSITPGSEQTLTVNAGELAPGTYTYTLLVDEKIVDSKKFVLSR